MKWSVDIDPLAVLQAELESCWVLWFDSQFKVHTGARKKCCTFRNTCLVNYLGKFLHFSAQEIKIYASICCCSVYKVKIRQLHSAVKNVADDNCQAPYSTNSLSKETAI